MEKPMMRAISLHQPYASAMALGFKTNETRSRPITERIYGDLAICATKRLMDPWDWQVVKSQMALFGFTEKDFDVRLPDYARGAVLAVVELYGCVRTNNCFVNQHDDEVPEGYVPLTTHESLFGNYSPGRFAWRTRNVRKLKKPIHVRGGQGFFFLPPDIEAQVREQI